MEVVRRKRAARGSTLRGLVCRAGNNITVFHADFRDGDLNNVADAITDFTFNLYCTVILTAHQFITDTVNKRRRNKGNSTEVTETDTHTATGNINDFSREFLLCTADMYCRVYLSFYSATRAWPWS